MKKKYLFFAAFSVIITSCLCQFFNKVGLDSWYIQIQKPAITPPNYVFPIVWNILYLLLATSFYKILISRKNKKRAIKLYLYQLTLQVMWCVTFFAMKSFLGGTIILIAMNILAKEMMKEFKKIDRKTPLLLLPYNIWIFYALLINLSFVATTL